MVCAIGAIKRSCDCVRTVARNFKVDYVFCSGVAVMMSYATR
jgi:hypothetical protein